jgi:hypothetical protein
MTGLIVAGDILIEAGTYLPNFLATPKESCLPGWTAVLGGLPAFEKATEQAGWTLFFMAGEIEASAFGFDRQRTALAALKKLGAIVKSQNCNCMEITDVTKKSFLALPYMRVRAHTRHLQRSLVFSAAQSDERRTS